MISQQEILNIMEISKTALAVQKLKDGDLKGALSVFSTFKYDLTRAERRTIQIAYETLSGNSAFYRSLGIDSNELIENAQEILSHKYLNSNKLNKVSKR